MNINENKLKGLIKSKGHTYETLAQQIKKMGFSADQSTISNVANNRHSPSYATMQGLYQALEMNPEEAAEIFFGKELHESGKAKQEA